MTVCRRGLSEPESPLDPIRLVPLTFPGMNALSRREEDTLMKATKAHALKECDPLVKGTRNNIYHYHKFRRG